MKNRRKIINVKHYILITMTYISAHWFLLIATGRWWDDWVYADKNWDYLWDVWLQSSLPLRAFIDGGLWLLPDGFHRILAFVLFYIGAILFYKILRKLDFISEEGCFLIVLLYTVIPINDARVLWICFGYSLGLFMYWIAFYLGTLWKEYKGVKKITIRILSLLILMISFDAESIMILTLLIIAYFFYQDLRVEWKWTDGKENFKKLIKEVILHIDYFVAPVIWYFGDKILFPGYGVYGGHSYVHWGGLLETLICSPSNSIMTLANIVKNYINVFLDYKADIFIAILTVVIIIIAFKSKKEEDKDQLINKKKKGIMAFIGFVIFFLGFFPYSLTRDKALIAIYTDSRDTLLLGIGLSITLYYLVDLIPIDIVKKAVISILILCGVVHFNFTYLKWQEGYYQQLQLQHEIKQNENILNNNTFLIMYKNNLITDAFYQTSGNSFAATGEETRYYIPGTDNMYDLLNMNEETWFLNAYGINEYDYGDKIIDGIIFVDYSEISKKDILIQKWNELFNSRKFNTWIDSIKNIKYVAISPEESNKLMGMRTNGELSDEMIYDKYY